MYKIYTGVFMYDVCKKITACETFLRSGGKFLTTVFGDFLPSWMIYFVGHLFVIYMCSISKTVYRHLHAAWFPVTFECCSRYVLLHCVCIIELLWVCCFVAVSYDVVTLLSSVLLHVQSIAGKIDWIHFQAELIRSGESKLQFSILYNLGYLQTNGSC